MSPSMHGDVASAIGQQVEQMILQAKKDSEARVRHDLQVAQNQLQHMKGLIAELGERVNRVSRNGGAGTSDPSQTVDRAFLSSKIAFLEQKWGSEVKALKQDLHRTILAHNHNSDLMRHHRDALDEARRKLDAQTQPKAEQVDAQIEKVDRMLRAGQSKQRALDALTERLTAIEQQVGELLPSAPMPANAFPPMMQGMAGMNAMMQPPIGQQRELASAKQKQKRDGDVSEASRLGQGAGDSGITFNAEAPIFVPRGAPATAEAKAEKDMDKVDDKGEGAEAGEKSHEPIDLPPPAGLDLGADDEADSGEKHED